MEGRDGWFRVSFGEMKRLPICMFFTNIRNVFSLDELGLEIAQIAIPAVIALTADPIASLVDTAFIGHLGTVELAAVGVSIAVFNQVSKIAIFPLVSITTSFVAEEDAAGSTNSNTTAAHKMELMEAGEKCKLMPDSNSDVESETEDTISDTRKNIPSASSAIIIGASLGLIQAIFLISCANPILRFMGIGSDSQMIQPAVVYLTVRSLGAPAILLSLAMQGVYRGFKDTKTPFGRRCDQHRLRSHIHIYFGVAVAHIISQYLIAAILLCQLTKQVHLLPPSLKNLQFGRFLKNGFLLLMRVVAVTFCVTLAASMAARQGPNNMAAFQVCLQVWMTTSLIADGLAIAGQAILARAFAQENFHLVPAVAARVLQLGLVLGLLLSGILGVGLKLGAKIFTQDVKILRVIDAAIPFVAATQPINALAFVFDGVNFGASDFSYSAYSMIVVAFVSSFCILTFSSTHGFIGIWVALTIYMALRALAGFWRIGTGTGPWKFLRRPTYVVQVVAA